MLSDLCFRAFPIRFIDAGDQHDITRDQTMKIISGPLSMFGAKVEIAAHEKGIDFELVMVPFSQRRGYDPKRAAHQPEAAGAGADRRRS